MRLNYEDVLYLFLSHNTRVVSKKEEFISAREKVKVECSKCNSIFSISWFKFKNKKHKFCEPCSRTQKKSEISTEEAKKVAQSFGTTIITNLKNIDSTTAIEFICTKCSVKQKRQFGIFIREAKKGRTTCYNCGVSERIEKSRDRQKEKVEEICSEQSIDLIEYNERYSKFRCPSCLSEFTREPKYLTDKYPNRTNLCPKCSNGKWTSTTEDKLVFELQKYTTVETNRRDLIPPKEIDIYLPEYKIGIEVNGLRYHSELAGKDKNYHLNKTIISSENKITLLHFWDTEIDKKFDLVISMILSKLGIGEKIYARKTKKREVSNADAKRFFERNHIDGFVNGKHIGLFYDDTLVSCITIGKSRFKKNEIELLRFASEMNTSVIGGFSKLTNDIGDLVSFANRRFSTGQVYEKNNWKLISTSKPSYWYFKNKKMYHRSAFMKHKLPKLLSTFDPTKTEWENMKENGWDRVWDCGVFKYKKG